MKYKMLVSDLDGTLLDSGMRIPREIREAVAFAREKGIYVILCSGRCYISMLIFEKALGPIPEGQLGISFNGGSVYEALPVKILTDYRLERGLAFEIIDGLKSLGAPVLVYQCADLYAEHETPDITAYRHSSMMPVTLLDDFNEIQGDISKILIRSGKPVIESLEQSLRDLVHGRCGVYFSAHNLLEYCPLTANKGLGLKYVCDRLGIDASEVIAVGDQNNDIPMLREAGLGVAVGNATDETKNAADIAIGETNDQFAVAKIIYNYFR